MTLTPKTIPATFAPADGSLILLSRMLAPTHAASSFATIIIHCSLVIVDSPSANKGHFLVGDSDIIFSAEHPDLRRADHRRLAYCAVGWSIVACVVTHVLAVTVRSNITKRSFFVVALLFPLLASEMSNAPFCFPMPQSCMYLARRT